MTSTGKRPAGGASRRRRTIFVSDVHLRPGERAKEEVLLAFLDETVGPTHRLFILGDFFDLWVGPRHHGLGEYDRVVERLGKVSRSGTETYFLPGNRDFYGAELLAREIGARFVPTPRTFELDGMQVYVAHGDSLCLRDLRYRVGRALVRNPLAEWFFLNFPLRLSFFLAHSYRTLSRRLLAHRDSRIVRAAPELVQEIFSRGAEVIVTGHFHRVEEQVFEVDGRRCRLFSLGDWSEQASYLELVDGTFTFRSFATIPHS